MKSNNHRLKQCSRFHFQFDWPRFDFLRFLFDALLLEYLRLFLFFFDRSAILEISLVFDYHPPAIIFCLHGSSESSNSANVKFEIVDRMNKARKCSFHSFHFAYAKQIIYIRMKTNHWLWRSENRYWIEWITSSSIRDYSFTRQNSRMELPLVFANENFCELIRLNAKSIDLSLVEWTHLVTVVCTGATFVRHQTPFEFSFFRHFRSWEFMLAIFLQLVFDKCLFQLAVVVSISWSTDTNSLATDPVLNGISHNQTSNPT